MQLQRRANKQTNEQIGATPIECNVRTHAIHHRRYDWRFIRVCVPVHTRTWCLAIMMLTEILAFIRVI